MSFQQFRYIAASILALGANCACAQTFTWRIPTYGVESSVAGIAKQSLAFDVHDNLYTFEMVADTDGVSARVKHYDAATGAVEWQRDVPASVYVPGYFETGFSLSSAALAPLGDDVVVATTNEDLQFAGRIARFRGSDGALMWQAGEQADTGIGYTAVAVTHSGDVVVSGAIGVGDGSLKGHVAKYDGINGALLWSVDLDPALCGSGPAHFLLSSVAIDGNDDVVVVGATTYDSNGTVFCAAKLHGDTGAPLWRQGHQASTSYGAYGPSLFVDPNGNALIGVHYQTGTYAYALAKLDATTGSIIWALVPVTFHGQPVAYPTLGMDADGNAIVSSEQTQEFAAADGHPRWVSEAPVGGAIAVDSDHDILIAHNDAVDTVITTGRKIDFYALNPSDGSQRWASSLAVNTFAYWSPDNLIAADSAGHFAALQTESNICCTETQALVGVGDSSSGAMGWSVSDRDFGPSNAYLAMDEVSHNRSSALTPDGGVVTVGVTYRWTNYVSGSARIMTIKRSQRDGRLLWRSVAELGLEFCARTSVAVDSNGDVIVGGECFKSPVTIKYRGSDGKQLWVGLAQDACDYAVVDSLAVDAANDVYATGVCNTPNDENQLTVKYSGANGALLWTRHTEGTDVSPWPGMGAVPLSLSMVGDGVLIAANQPIPDDGFNTRLIVSKLLTNDGSVGWTRPIDPPSGSAFSLQSIAAFANGDAVVSGGTMVTRLDGATGNTKWSNENVPGGATALAIDTNGDLLFVGGDVGKMSGLSGTIAWTFQDPRISGFYTGLNDVIAAPDGSVLATGAASAVANANANLYVVSIDGTTGVPRWSLIDTSRQPDYDTGIGVLVAADGGILVSANYAAPDSSPWSLVRITGPFADGIFANGLEP